MVQTGLRWLGRRAVHAAVAGGKKPPLLDFGFGFSLLRDKRIPVGTKALALSLGGVLMAALVAFELPVEAIIAFFLNIPGLGLDMLIDGMELVAGPVVFGALLLTKLAPKATVAQLHQERYGGQMLNP